MAESKNWLLLRGLARGIGHWGSFEQRMREKFPQDRFELIDLPGNGERNFEVSPLSIGEYVKDLRSRCSYVNAGEEFQVLAVSLGAMITVEWMRLFPHEISKSYLVCTSSAGLSPFYERFNLANIPKGLRLLGQERDEALWESVILEMITNNQDRRDAEKKALEVYTSKYPISAKNVFRQMLAASRYRFPEQAPGDVRIIGSHGDRLVSSKCSLRIANLWGMEAAMHPWAGHDLAIDDPQWLIEHLL